MLTRNKKQIKGFYCEKNVNNSLSNEYLNPQNFKKDFERLNLSILHKLKNTFNVQKVVSVNISNSFKNFLIKRYKLTKRFANCSAFLIDFDYNPVNYFTKRNFCKIQQETFKMKIDSDKKVKFRDENLKEQIKILKSNSVSLKFICENEIIDVF
jgi:hypothetical protein